MRGGKRPGAGRKPGVPNKASAERQAAIAVSGDTPIEVLIAIMRDPQTARDMQLDAAKAAAPYVHPRLASVTHKGDPNAPIHQVTRIELVPVEPKPTA